MLSIIMLRSIIQEFKLCLSHGVMTLTPMTLNKTALSILGLSVILSINPTQQNNNQHLAV
jgi:hypothetical protein